MEVVILCGGRGERLREYTDVIPKPMVQIGDQPILWHVMKMYAHAGYDKFTLCLGYKGEIIRRFFTGNSETSASVARWPSRDDAGHIEVVHCEESWTVRLVDTGEHTMTGGRLKRIESLLEDETFLVTYADCVSDVDLRALVKFHCSRRRLATVTVVKPPPRFGVVRLAGDRVVSFAEKRPEDEPWISGGFFVFHRRLFEHLHHDAVVLEQAPLAQLAASNELSAFVHDGFWQCVDTVSDAMRINARWEDGNRPWARWEMRSPRTGPSTPWRHPSSKRSSCSPSEEGAT